MPAKLLSSPTKNAIQKTLAAQLLSTATTADPITFDDVDGLPNLPGVLVIRRVDTAGAATPAFREYIEYSGTSGNTVLITTRNVDGSNAALTHPVGSIVEFIPDVIWADRIYDALSNVVSIADLSVDLTKIVTPSGTQSLSGKTFSDAITLAQIATPANPSAGRNKIYTKSDDKVYRLTSAGVESEVGSSSLTTKGDLQTFSTVAARLGVGTNGQRLVAASGETTGLVWQSTTLGYAQVVANQSSITSIVDLTSLTVDVTVPAGARIRITGAGTFTQASTSGSIELTIFEGATQLVEAMEQVPTAALQQAIYATVILTPSTGAHTYKLRARTATGAGAATLSAAATNPAYILVEMI